MCHDIKQCLDHSTRRHSRQWNLGVLPEASGARSLIDLPIMTALADQATALSGPAQIGSESSAPRMPSPSAPSGSPRPGPSPQVTQNTYCPKSHLAVYLG